MNKAERSIVEEVEDIRRNTPTVGHHKEVIDRYRALEKRGLIRRDEPIQIRRGSEIDYNSWPKRGY